jgi:hypothetical protein
MRSPLAAVFLTAFACLFSPVALAGDHEPHPLVGEPPAPMHWPTASGDAASPHHKLATLLVGLPVYDVEQTEVGQVMAVLFAGDGAVDMLIVRIADGAKDVALPFDAVATTADRDGQGTIVIDMPAEEIASAPRFDGVEEISPTPR